MVRESLAQYKNSFSSYIELRAHENVMQTILILAGNVASNQLLRKGGVSARSRRGGAWGFASRPEFSSDAIKYVINAASENVDFLASRRPDGSDFPSLPCSSVNDLRSGVKQPRTHEMLDFLKTLDDYIVKKYPGLMSRYVRLQRFDHEKNLLTSDGSESYIYLPNTHINIGLTADSNYGPVELTSRSRGGLGGFSDLYDKPETLFPVIDALYEELAYKCEGIYPDAGIKDCILGPDLAGILAHEAVGHTVEADLVRSGSVASDLLGKEVASEKISIIDFAHTAFGETVPVPVYTDDEGTCGTDAVIIDKGILVGYMHNKESAAEYNVTPNGNARGFTFSDEPLIRMRNTAILPGTDKLEDMLESLDDGYYLCCPTNGQADMTGEFMFGVSMGFEVKNGKKGRALLDTTVSGVAFEMLKTVEQVSDNVEWVSSGFCGKKQAMRVSMGGPAIRCKINVGGR